jgi:hypothetical protein
MEIPAYKGKPIIPSTTAQKELDELGKDLWFIQEVRACDDILRRADGPP